MPPLAACVVQPILHQSGRDKALAPWSSSSLPLQQRGNGISPPRDGAFGPIRVASNVRLACPVALGGTTSWLPPAGPVGRVSDTLLAYAISTRSLPALRVYPPRLGPRGASLQASSPGVIVDSGQMGQERRKIRPAFHHHGYTRSQSVKGV